MAKQARTIVPLTYNNQTAFRANGSVIPFGDMYGKGVIQTLMSRPDYIFNSRRLFPHTPLTAEFNYQIGKIDTKPFLSKCSCGNTADCYISPGYRQSLIFKCSTCQPLGAGTTNPNWRVGRSLNDLQYMFGQTYAQIRNQIRRAARDIIRAKGYVGNITFKKANRF